MKILTYNLHNGGRTGQPNHWERIINEISPDIVLAQETFNPRGYLPTSDLSDSTPSVVWSPLPAQWGSAIFSPTCEFEPVLVHDEFQGWVVGAKTHCLSIGETPKQSLLIFSIHTPTAPKTDKTVSYEKRVALLLDHLQEIAQGDDVLIGGDFNITTAVRQPDEELRNSKQELAILHRLEKDFGLVNAWQAANPNTPLPQTLRWSGNRYAPYHCDGIFIPKRWLPHLDSCDVLSDGWSDWSDHNPIVATLI